MDSLRNSLRFRVIIAFSFSLFLILSSQLIVRFVWTIPELKSMENISDEKDVQRIHGAIDSILESLALVNYDNSVWDDPYNYMVTHDQAFLEANFIEDVFRSINLDGIYLYDREGVKIWGETRSHDNFQLIHFDSFDTPSDKVKKFILVKPEEVKTKPITHEGFIRLEGKNILFAATSIMPSDGRGEPRGTLVFWRYFSDSTEKAIANKVKLPIEFQWLDGQIQQPVQEETPSIFKMLSGRNHLRDQHNMISTDLFSFDNKRLLKIKYQASASLYNDQLFDISLVVGTLLSLTSLIFLLLFLDIQLLKPFKHLHAFMNKVIESDSFQLRLNSDRKDEFGKLSQQFDKMIAHIQKQNDLLKLHNLKLEKLSYTDKLTGVANRAALDDYLNTIFTAYRDDTPISLLMVDIDFFKSFNEHYGQQKGDMALKLVATAIKQNTRNETDLLARYGDDEFMIVLQKTNSVGAMLVAQKILLSVPNLMISHIYSGCSKVLTVSIGVTTFIPHAKSSIEEAITEAEEALSHAKTQGRNTCIMSEKSQWYG